MVRSPTFDIHNNTKTGIYILYLDKRRKYKSWIWRLFVQKSEQKVRLLSNWNIQIQKTLWNCWHFSLSSFTWFSQLQLWLNILELFPSLSFKDWWDLGWLISAFVQKHFLFVMKTPGIFHIRVEHSRCWQQLFFCHTGIRGSILCMEATHKAGVATSWTQPVRAQYLPGSRPMRVLHSVAGRVVWTSAFFVRLGFEVE